MSAVQKRLNAFGRHWSLSGERLLDVGCGNGAYTTVLGEGFEEVHAIDVEPHRIEQFRQRSAADPKYSIAVGTAEALDFPDDHFDVVTAIEVLEHIVDLDRALGEIGRVLRPGGAFLVSCPNRLFPLETHTVMFGKHRTYPARRIPFLPYIKPLHRRLSTARNFTRRDLTELVCKDRLRVVAWDGVMPPLDNWRPGRRQLRPIMDWLERSPLNRFGVSIIGVFVKEGR
ncbi:MAG: methyltransferase domain-containing protein [Actinomycetota bacterium]|nr:methyltransferase domain-containing protein [Actinomycetota bacterium]